MRYLIHDIELEAPLAPISLCTSADGVALIVRRGGRPAGFVMQPAMLGAVLQPAEVARLLAQAGHAPEPAPAPLACNIDRSISLTAAICTRNRPERLERCLRSVCALRAAAPPDLTFEILVVDNAPPDDR